MRKKSFLLSLGTLLALVSCSVQASLNPTVCAVPQVYAALEASKTETPQYYKTFYAPLEDLESRISNNEGPCDIVISSEEKFGVLMLRANKTEMNSIQPFVKAPLILWSADENLFKDNIKVITKKKLKSIAIPIAKLSPVGFAASQITKKKEFPTDYLKHRLYRTEHEYQTYAMVSSGNVQVGFLTKPLIMDKGNKTGSYWAIDRSYYEPINYYIIKNAKSINAQTLKVYEYLKSSPKALTHFYNTGFESLETH